MATDSYYEQKKNVPFCKCKCKKIRKCLFVSKKTVKRFFKKVICAKCYKWFESDENLWKKALKSTRRKFKSYRKMNSEEKKEKITYLWKQARRYFW